MILGALAWPQASCSRVQVSLNEYTNSSDGALTEHTCDSTKSIEGFVKCALCKSLVTTVASLPACIAASWGACFGVGLGSANPVVWGICTVSGGAVCNQIFQKIAELGNQVMDAGSPWQICEKMDMCDKYENKPPEFVKDPRKFCSDCERLLGVGTEKCKSGSQAWCKTRRNGMFSLSCVPM